MPIGANSQERWSNLKLPNCSGLFCSRDNGAFQNIPEYPRKGAVYAPYVKLRLPDGTITVGNNSAPLQTGGSAPVIISNFDYGFEVGHAGFKATFELLDAGQTMYRKIATALNKAYSEENMQALSTWFDFGWILLDENNSPKLVSVYTLTGKVIYGVPMNLQTSFDGGVVKIKFEINSPLVAAVTRDITIGDERQLVNLKDALRVLFSKLPPTTEIEFQSADGAPTNDLEEFKFPESQGGRNGPLGIWKMDMQDKLNTARMWLSDYYSKKNKSFLLLYDPIGPIDSGKPAKVIIKENPVDSKRDCCQNILRQYVVNGGSDSNVISFSPNINWFPDWGKAKVNGGAASPDTQEKSANDYGIKTGGSALQASLNENYWYNTDPANQASLKAKSLASTIETMNQNALGKAANFEADLKILGDPSLHSPIFLVGKSVSVLYLNSFLPKMNAGNLEWNNLITNSNCNSIISNKRYLIKGVSHQIQGGQFFTTLKLMLALPNQTIGYDEQIGGNGCGEEKFESEKNAALADLQSAIFA